MVRLISNVSFVIVLLAFGYFAGTFSCSAQASKKVEYKVTSIEGVSTENLPQFEALLNKMGTAGWEMVGITPGMFGVIFKR